MTNICTTEYNPFTFEARSNAVAKSINVECNISSHNILQNKFISSKFNFINSKKYVIPKIYHQIWLTNKYCFNKLNYESINNIKRNISVLKLAHSNFKVFLWSNYLESLNNVLYDNFDHKSDFFIKKINNLFAVNELHGLKENIEVYINNNIFSFASDIIRYTILYQYGGIYSDISYVFESVKTLSYLVDKYKFIAGIDLQNNYFNFIGNGILFSVPNHEIINYTLTLINSNLNKSSSALEYFKFSDLEWSKLFSSTNLPLNFSICEKINDGDAILLYGVLYDHPQSLYDRILYKEIISQKSNNDIITGHINRIGFDSKTFIDNEEINKNCSFLFENNICDF